VVPFDVDNIRQRRSIISVQQDNLAILRAISVAFVKLEHDGAAVDGDAKKYYKKLLKTISHSRQSANTFQTKEALGLCQLCELEPNVKIDISKIRQIQRKLKVVVKILAANKQLCCNHLELNQKESSNDVVIYDGGFDLLSSSHEEVSFPIIYIYQTVNYDRNITEYNLITDIGKFTKASKFCDVCNIVFKKKCLCSDSLLIHCN
jgi:hypothetical protein